MKTIYNYERNLEKALKNLDSKRLSKKNKNQIKEFIYFLSVNKVGKCRQLKYVFALQNIAEWLKIDFEKATKKDIEYIINKMENIKQSNGQPFSEWSKHDHRVIIKKFYTWLRNKENDDIDEWETPKEVKWVKAKKPRNCNKLPSDLLTPQDITFLSDNCKNLREKALILTLYESGARIGELLSLKIKDVEFDDYGAMLNLFGKTGYRKIRIVGSSPALSQWLQNEHPKRDDKNAYLFCNINQGNEGTLLSYASAKKILNNLKKRTDFKKPLNPHHFRHSRASELAEHLTDSQRCHYLGWQQGSQMARIYTHIEDTNRIILELNGLVKKDKDKTGKFSEVICPRCSTKNAYGSKFCGQCSMGLDIKSIDEFEKTRNDALKTIENNQNIESIVEMVMKKLEEKY